jgi:two-component system, OmpR family, copper resistance phosphate regulon response regulator CusR
LKNILVKSNYREVPNMNILVVDNDHNTVETLKAVITTKTGYVVDVAYNGKEGLDKMRRGVSYDLLVLDIMMPEMNGIDVCKAIIADEKIKKIPILLISALPVLSAEFQASLKEFEEFKLIVNVMEKPFRVDDLITKINASIHAS